MKQENERSISWNPNVDQEAEDRATFLALSSEKRWEHMMAVILATYPGGAKAVTYKKRKIEWR